MECDLRSFVTSLLNPDAVLPVCVPVSWSPPRNPETAGLAAGVHARHTLPSVFAAIRCAHRGSGVDEEVVSLLRLAAGFRGYKWLIIRQLRE